MRRIGIKYTVCDVVSTIAPLASYFSETKTQKIMTAVIFVLAAGRTFEKRKMTHRSKTCLAMATSKVRSLTRQLVKGYKLWPHQSPALTVRSNKPIP
jgi:hypothetical protein